MPKWHPADSCSGHPLEPESIIKHRPYRETRLSKKCHLTTGLISRYMIIRVGWGKAPPLRSQRPTAEYIAHNKELSNAHKEAYEGNIKNDKIIIPSYLLRYYER